MFNDLWSEYESIYNDLVNDSACDSATVINAVILSAVGKTHGLQQHASEEGLRTQDHGKGSNAPTVASMEN
jgi:apolipoprotein N-acyltransferase